MESVVVAMGILMWMWGAASLRLVQRLPSAMGTTRSAWLALAVAVGGGLLVAMSELVLPGSVLSQGWSRESLLAAQSWILAVVVVMAVLGIGRGHRLLSPRTAGRAPARPAAARPPTGADARGAGTSRERSPAARTPPVRTSPKASPRGKDAPGGKPVPRD